MMDTDIAMKRCSKCGEVKPMEGFTKDKKRSDGRHPYCRDCRHLQAVDYYNKNKERFALKGKEYRTKYPERKKSCDARYRAENRDKIQSRKKHYYHKNRETILEAQARKIQENKDDYLLWWAKWREKNRELLRNRDKVYYRKNRDHRLEKEKLYRQKRQLIAIDDIRKTMAKWREKNRDKVRAYQHNYRARKRNAVGKVTHQQLMELFRKQKGYCAYCGVKLRNPFTRQGKGAIPHDDHIHPLSRGGSNDISNHCWACAECNLSKGDKMLHEWKVAGRLC